MLKGSVIHDEFEVTPLIRKIKSMTITQNAKFLSVIDARTTLRFRAMLTKLSHAHVLFIVTELCPLKFSIEHLVTNNTYHQNNSDAGVGIIKCIRLHIYRDRKLTLMENAQCIFYKARTKLGQQN